MKHTIYTNILNEQRYIEQWIQYHLNLGFDNIILFEDTIHNSDSHKIITDKYPQVKLIQYTEELVNDITNKYSCCKQYPYNYMDRIITLYLYDNYRNDLDYCIKLDVDEYICGVDTISELTNNLMDSYLLKWHIMDVNNKIIQDKQIYDVLSEYPNEANIDKNVIDNILLSKNSYNMCKQMFLIKALDLDDLSLPEIPHKILNNDNTVEYIYIKHFLTKSFQEFYNRIINKGEYCLGYHRKIHDFFAINPSMIDKIPEIEQIFNIKLLDIKTKLNK